MRPMRPMYPMQIFEMDESKRININDIKMHPWYTHPLPAVYENALMVCAVSGHFSF